MKRWAFRLTILAAVIALSIVAFAVWAHHMYTVGMDLNFKALFVAGMGLVVAVCLLFAAWRVVRHARAKND